jgi:hypothetical protein
VSRPYCAAITSCPSARSAGISFWKHEPSAQIPWAKTMLGLVMVFSSVKDWDGLRPGVPCSQTWGCSALPFASQELCPAEKIAGRSYKFEHPLACKLIVRLGPPHQQPIEMQDDFLSFSCKNGASGQGCGPPGCIVRSARVRNQKSSVKVSHTVQRRRRMAAPAVSFRRRGLFRGRSARSRPPGPPSRAFAPNTGLAWAM